MLAYKYPPPLIVTNVEFLALLLCQNYFVTLFNINESLFLVSYFILHLSLFTYCSLAYYSFSAYLFLIPFKSKFISLLLS